MKKIIFLAGFGAMAFACGNNSTESKSADSTAVKTEQAPVSAAADDKGVELIAASDCLTCHKVNEKSIGPAYVEVAKKYTADEATIDTLASKILKGGSGVWGQVPMTPHPQISADDAKIMVKYILTLKNQ
jgi:cytochrome c